jgi:hypothetical protein
MCRLAKFGTILTGLALWCWPAPILAGPTVPYKDRAAGRVTDVAPTINPAEFRVTIEGDGVATHSGKFHVVASHTVNGNTGLMTNGQLTSRAADGSTIVVTYSGSTTPPDPTGNAG